jgi:DNA helicase-2/ATP-dependent DNA helicase PcrA
MALERILNIPNRKIGVATFDKLNRYSHLKEISVFAAMSQVFSITSITHEKQITIYEFYQMINSYMEAFKSKNIAITFKNLLNDIAYKPYLKKISQTENEFTQKLSLVKEFIQSLFDYEERSKEPSLSKFLDKILLREQENDDDKAKNLVTLMSLHASKGLEFPLVFIIGMEEGIFPSSRTLKENDDDVSEERRLAYVGITRSKRQLHLSSVKERKHYKKIVPSEFSRFLIEIPSNLYDISPTDITNVEEKEKQTELAAKDFFSQISQFRK